MILVTVGTQLPFDRLIYDIEDWYKNLDVKPEIFVQVGNSTIKSKFFECVKEIEPKDFATIVSKCDFIISHAGMGSILTALKYNKPIVIMPRSSKLGEHRNDHQIHTSKSFKNTPGVYVAGDKEELFRILLHKSDLVAGSLESSEDYEALLEYIRFKIQIN